MDGTITRMQETQSILRMERNGGAMLPPFQPSLFGKNFMPYLLFLKDGYMLSGGIIPLFMADGQILIGLILL